MDWLWTVSILGGCGGLERTYFEQFLLWEGVVVMKELIFHSCYFGRVWWCWKNWFWTVSTLGGCGGLERTDFEQFLLWEGVVVGCSGVVVLKELTFNSFYFGRVWWSWKNWFWTVSTLGGCGGLGRTYGRCTGKHWGHTRGCLNIWRCLGIRGHQGCLNAWGHPNIWGLLRCLKHMGVSHQCPKM